MTNFVRVTFFVQFIQGPFACDMIIYIYICIYNMYIFIYILRVFIVTSFRFKNVFTTCARFGRIIRGPSSWRLALGYLRI